MKVMMMRPSMSLFALLKFLALRICEIGSHLPVRLGNHLMDTPAGVAPDIPQLRGDVVDDRRDLGDLLFGEIEVGAESVLHLSADPLGTMRFKEMTPGI